MTGSQVGDPPRAAKIPLIEALCWLPACHKRLFWRMKTCICGGLDKSCDWGGSVGRVVLSRSGGSGLRDSISFWFLGESPQFEKSCTQKKPHKTVQKARPPGHDDTRRVCSLKEVFGILNASPLPPQKAHTQKWRKKNTLLQHPGEEKETSID